MLGVSFGYGVGVGSYQWPPYGILKSIKQRFSDRESEDTSVGNPESQLLNYAFSDPMISGDQVSPAITTLDEIAEAVRSMAMPVKDYWDVYQTMTVGAPQAKTLDSGQTELIEVTYQVGTLEFSAHAYIDASDGWGGKQSAVLVIPGSGENQSSEIDRHVESNYQQNILDVFGDDYDAYIFIKPNQDCLAIHNGEKKLSRDFYSNWLMDHGSSYGAHYVTNAIALVKTMQEEYDRVIVAGMSQGGEATMLIALQSEPDVAIISSGYSAVYEKVKWSGSNQIVIPGIGPRLTADRLRESLSKQSTQYLFTWGQDELATYGIEAKHRVLGEKLDGLPNVRCESHNGGHEFPISLIREFLKE